MSYDLTIRSDEDCSRSYLFADLAAFVATLPDVEPNGDRGFALNDPPNRWMEIYLEFRVFNDDERDFDDDPTRTNFNWVSVCIPYGHIGRQPERDYFPTAFAIAEHLGWPVYDEQRGRVLQQGEGRV